MNVQRELLSGVVVCCLGLLCPPIATGQPQADPIIPADEMSSLEWRDCAGHFFFVATQLANEAKAQNSKPDSAMMTMLNTWGYMAVYAGDYKARTEAREGKLPPLGRSLRDPKAGGMTMFDVKNQVAAHEARLQAEGSRDAYVTRYRAKCYQPVQAFSKRFMTALDELKKKP